MTVQFEGAMLNFEDGDLQMLRVQSAEGTQRVEASGSESTAALYERVHEALRLRSFAFALHRDRARREELASSKSRRLQDLGLQHGDMLYLSPVNGAVLFESQAEAQASNNEDVHMEAGPSTSTAMDTAAPPASDSKLVEDEVDLQLYQMSGLIQRQRDDKLCRHNSAGCCVHCSPLEPYDEGFLRAQNIKHLSFHAYLRKLQAGSKFVDLREPSLTIKPGCREHPPWPRGVCSKCQPAALSLARQAWRLVDNVLLESPALVDRFLGYWRASGHQRLGYLLGRYEPHPDVPLGIRARVAAIYEPPQSSSRDHVTLAPDDPLDAPLAALCDQLGLRRVGWLFTDLLPQPDQPGRVQCTRGVETHFLSAQEVVMAAHFQSQRPHACRHAAGGRYGSKFVTVCVTGDKTNQIHLEGYQVSTQAMALQRAGLLLPSRDAPDLACVRAQPGSIVPDVYYTEKDAYGNEVKTAAQRVPVAFLLVDVPVGVPAAPPAPPAVPPTFSPRASFPPAHRPLQAQPQSPAALHHQIQEADTFLEAMSDLHTLLYVACNESLGVGLEALAPLVRAVAAQDAAAAAAWRADCGAWATLEHVARAAAAPPPRRPRPPSADLWVCALCTFHNEARRDACEMCAMPR
ncbi:hypothetical protein MSG28_007560 [Choristoneura fumiferana]|uniref:Uncharacterized protein n=1 Tax=Choristoneura fumiferana TaxID=7141 RepID=A0ACC0JXP6_CHOFU|nr:hypothetical protein MSG28_007560 [Choristoneura fumiferana]